MRYPRWLPGSVVLLLLLIPVACDDRQPLGPEAVPAGLPLALAVSDGSRGGNPGFFFLPPLGPVPRPVGTFDGTLAPVVELCAWAGPVCDGAPLASVSAAPTGDEAYEVELKLKGLGLTAGVVYRLRVLVEGNVLGYVDVSPKKGSKGELQLARSGTQAGANDIVAVNPNRTLPVRFRIDQGAIALPTPSFSVGGVLQARQPIVFDASASSAPDGGTLSYAWDFGDGGRGGGEGISHLYRAGGDFEVTLTVTTEAGIRASTTRTVSVADPPPPAGVATVRGSLESVDGAPLSGVEVGVVGGGASATSDASGSVSLAGVPTGVPVSLRLRRGGFADQIVALDLPASVTQASFQATLRSREPARDVPSIEAGVEVQGADGARVELGPGALVRPDGTPALGTASVSLTSVDVSQPDAGGFPGGFSAVERDGSPAELLSYGATEFLLTQGGEPLDLAPGQKAVIEIPLSVPAALGETLPLWSLDEELGLWVREGDGVVVASGASPTGLALRAEVSHFSWWNIDIATDPHTLFLQCLEAGVPVTCTVRGSFQLPDQPVRVATEVVPAAGESILIPGGVDVTMEAVGDLDARLDQAVVNGAAGGSSTLILNLVGGFSATVRCEDGSGTPLPCTLRDTGGGPTVYENIPADGKTLTLLPDTPITLRAFEAGGLTGETTLQGGPFESGTFVVVLTQAFLVDAACNDRFGAPAPCTLEWSVPGVGPRTASVGVGGTTLSLPGDEAITLRASDLYGVFTGIETVQGPAGTSQSVVVELVGQGGTFCGAASGRPLSLSVVTVIPGGACAPGVVSSPQEAILFVSHGGTIRFDEGTHRAVRLDVPRDDLTLEPVAGTRPVILAGTGEPGAYDGAGFKFLGAGDLVVRRLTFRSPGTGIGGMGFITGPNSVFGAGSYDSFLVDDVELDSLRIGVVVVPSASPAAQVTVRESGFHGSSRVNGQGILVISNASGTVRMTLEGNEFEGQPATDFSGLNAFGLGLTPPPVWMEARDNTFRFFERWALGLLAGAADGTVVSGNVFSDPLGDATAALTLHAAPGATVTVADNTLTGGYLGGDRADQASWAMAWGIQLRGDVGATFDLRRNSLSSVRTALEHQGPGTTTATDQVIDQVHVPIRSSDAPRVTLQNSDITDFSGSPYLQVGPDPFADGALRCNWWGDPAGPHGAGAGDPVVTPWAVAPIANGAGGACTGS